MIEINLLPVREEKRKADVRQFAAMLAAALAGSILLAGAVHTKLVADVVSTRGQLTTLQKQIDAFGPQLEQVERYRATKQAIEAKLEVIGRLDRSRSGPLHVLDELSTNSPERLWLTRLKAESGQITVEGMSLDNELVALFMTALGDSQYFDAVELKETEAKEVGGLRLNHFIVLATITTPGEPAPAPAAPAGAPGKKPAAASTGR
jgi:type IV pilus assembly protein PilN